MPCRSAIRRIGFVEREPLDLAEKLDAVARHAATEAVVKTPLLADVEARRLFLVKRAEAEVTPAAALELDPLADDLDDASFPPHPVDGV